jgi:DNA-binding CsgD family transcriptional regulator
MRNREHERSSVSPANTFRVRPKRFVFFDKSTGTERFEINANPDGSLPLDQAASLMAIHCLVRGRNPRDFGIMVSAEEDLISALTPVAKRLVQACATTPGPVQLSHRQREVLRALMQDGTNKEIAAKLNISERTVKFHVSALLEKFEVRSRVSLMRKAADFLLPENASNPDAMPRNGLHLLRADGFSMTERDRLRLQEMRVAGVQRASR